MATERIRTITSRQVKEQQAGATTMAPGIWIDAEGHMHISIPDIINYFGLPDTPELRIQMVERVKQMLADEGGTDVIVQSVQDA